MFSLSTTNDNNLSCDDEIFSGPEDDQHSGSRHNDHNQKQATKTTNDKSEELYKCEHCLKCFKRKSVLSNHIKVLHSTVQPYLPYKCHLCPLSFTRQRNWKDHISIYHSAAAETREQSPSYRCLSKGCTSKFKEKSDLKNHMLYLHTTDKPFKCYKCSFASKRKADLEVHIKNVHHNFACDECPYSFEKEQEFKRHLRVYHNRGKKYKCHLCFVIYISKSSLNNHMKSAHSGKTNNCSYKNGNATDNIKESGDIRLSNEIRRKEISKSQHEKGRNDCQPATEKTFQCKTEEDIDDPLSLHEAGPSNRHPAKLTDVLRLPKLDPDANSSFDTAEDVLKMEAFNSSCPTEVTVKVELSDD